MGGGKSGGSGGAASDTIVVSPTGYTSWDEGKTYQADPNTHFTVNGVPYYVEAGADTNDRSNWKADTMSGYHSTYDPNMDAGTGTEFSADFDQFKSDLDAQLASLQSQMESNLASIQAQSDAYKAKIAELTDSRKKRISGMMAGRTGTNTTGGLGDTSAVSSTGKALLGE